MLPILSKEAHPTQTGFVAGRDLVRNVVELDTYARAMHTTVMSDDDLVLLLCDMAATFSSVTRRWLRAVLRRLGVPLAVIRVIDALKSGMLLLLNMGGVMAVGLLTSGIAPVCPLSGVLFVIAADPVGRRIHSVLSRGLGSMPRQCADDTVVLLRSARLLSLLLPPFLAAGRFA